MSDGNYYSNIFDYLSSEKRTGSIAIICIIIIAIVIGFVLSNKNNKKPLIISIVLSVLLFLFYFGFQYSNYHFFKGQYSKLQEFQEEAKEGK